MMNEFVPRGSYVSFIVLLIEIFPARFDLVFSPPICPWLSEDGLIPTKHITSPLYNMRTLKLKIQPNVLHCHQSV